MPSFNQKGIAHLFLLVLLAAGIGLGVYLVGQKTNIFPRAAISDPISRPIILPSPSPSPSPTPAPTSKRVFVTKAQFNGNLGGLLGADQKCMAAAQSANLAGTFKAWLSSSTVSASSRLTKSPVPYKLLNGTVVASNWADLTDGKIQNPINVDETGVNIGTTSNYAAWTATNASGNIINPDNTCKNWTSISYYDAARTGLVNGNMFYSFLSNSSVYWTDVGSDSKCSGGTARLYCLEQ